MLQCKRKNSKGDGPAIPPVVYRELVAAAAPTTSDYVVLLPVCARQWLAVEAPAAVMCAANITRFVASYRPAVHVHTHVPRSLGTVGRWERTCEDWRKLQYLPANLDVL